MHRPRIALAFAMLIALGTGCSSGAHQSAPAHPPATHGQASPPTTPDPPHRPAPHPIDIYAADRANHLSPVVAHFKPLIYVPNSMSNTVDVIDPASGSIVNHFAVGRLPQHVVPSWDLKTLYVTNDLGDSLTPIDPRTGTPGPRIPVTDPYNLYFTTNGAYAIVVAERYQRLDFRDPHTFALRHSLHMPCVGVDHMDFAADGRYLIASCEFSGQVVKVDVATQAVVGTITLNGGRAKPQDVKVDPTGRVFYVADMIRGGVYTIEPTTFTVTGFIPTGAGAHGLYVSRDSKTMYITNRNAGSVSLLDFVTNRVTKTWPIPGGSPDMGGVSADGTTLWLSGRYNGEVYALDTSTGAVRQRIRVGVGPHGLCVYPQPGSYSLGHTGVFR